ncbi:unnamed protein product [Citrullus colocynthis]|uniref:Uncharacterized protein n=1 Tax=Citrullus colocynthis TaxID=252529 RepID=A0ABP0XMG8_9ROSI
MINLWKIEEHSGAMKGIAAPYRERYYVSHSPSPLSPAKQPAILIWGDEKESKESIECREEEPISGKLEEHENLEPNDSNPKIILEKEALRQCGQSHKCNHCVRNSQSENPAKITKNAFSEEDIVLLVFVFRKLFPNSVPQFNWEVRWRSACTRDVTCSLELRRGILVLR